MLSLTTAALAGGRGKQPSDVFGQTPLFLRNVDACIKATAN